MSENKIQTFPDRQAQDKDTTATPNSEIQKNTKEKLQKFKHALEYNDFQRQYLFEDPDYSLFALKKGFEEDPSGDFYELKSREICETGDRNDDMVCMLKKTARHLGQSTNDFSGTSFLRLGKSYNNGISEMRDIIKRLTSGEIPLSKQNIFEATGVNDTYIDNLEKNVYFIKMKPIIVLIKANSHNPSKDVMMFFDDRLQYLLHLTTKDDIFTHIGITEEEYNKIYIDALIDKDKGDHSLLSLKQKIIEQQPDLGTLEEMGKIIANLKRHGVSKEEIYQRTDLTDEWFKEANIEAILKGKNRSITAYLKQIQFREGNDDVSHNTAKNSQDFEIGSEWVVTNINRVTLKDENISEKEKRSLEKDIAEYEALIVSMITKLHGYGIKDTYISQRTGLSQAKIDELLKKYPKKEKNTPQQ